MSEWKEYKLGETLISANTGLDAIKRAPIVSFDTGIKCLRIQDVSQGKEYKKWGFTEVSENNFTKFKLLENDIIVARTGATVGVNMIIQNNLNSVFNNGLIRLRAKSEFSSRYIYYLLRSSDYWNHINSIAFGTTSQPNIQINQLLDFKVKVPTLKNLQNIIAEILCSLDDKIELNNKINQELETLAQLLFKQWFIDFEFPNENGEPYKSSGGEMVDSELGEIPKGWKVKKLKEIGNLKMGLSPKGESYNLEQIGIPLLNGAADYNNGLIEPKKYTTDAQRCNEIGDLVFCIRATIGNLVFADEIYCLGRGVASFKSTMPDNQFIIFQILNNSFEMLKSQASGSVILGLTKDDINDIKLIFNEAEFLNYSSLVSDFFKLIKSNRYENKELTSLRDTLLPKLISGELQLNDN